MLFIVLIGVSLILIGIGYGSIWLINKTTEKSFYFENEEKKKIEYAKKWSPVKFYAVKGTKFYSVVKTKEDKFFLINHFSPKLSAINPFTKVDKWQGVQISIEESQKIIDKAPYDYTMMGVATITTLLAIYVSKNSVAWGYWFTNRYAMILFALFALIGLTIGVMRMQINIKNFQEKKLLMSREIKILTIKSHQKYRLYIFIAWLIQFYWIPISMEMKFIFTSIVFEEALVRVYSTIGKVKMKKFNKEVKWIDKKLYGEEAYFTDISTPSEIFNDY